MQITYPVIVTVFISLVVFVMLQRKHHHLRMNTDQYYNYQSHKLLSSHDLALFKLLTKSVQGRYLVFPKVRMSHVLSPQNGMYDQASWQSAHDAAHHSDFDFVLCNFEDLSPQWVIQLKSPSEHHDMKIRFVEEVCTTSAIKLICLDIDKPYTENDIRALLLCGEEANQSSHLFKNVS